MSYVLQVWGQPFRAVAFWLRRPDIAWLLHRARQAAQVDEVIFAA